MLEFVSISAPDAGCQIQMIKQRIEIAVGMLWRAIKSEDESGAGASALVEFRGEP